MIATQPQSTANVHHEVKSGRVPSQRVRVTRCTRAVARGTCVFLLLPEQSMSMLYGRHLSVRAADRREKRSIMTPCCTFVLDPALATSYAHGLLVHLWQLMPWWLKVFGVPSGFALRLVYKPIKQCIEEGDHRRNIHTPRPTEASAGWLSQSPAGSSVARCDVHEVHQQRIDALTTNRARAAWTTPDRRGCSGELSPDGRAPVRPIPVVA